MVQILRSRLLHPGQPPEQLAKLDPQFAAFMECREETEKEGGDKDKGEGGESWSAGRKSRRKG